MFARPWLAMLLLVSYLLIAGSGFICAPNELRYAVAESHAHQVHHHYDRYADFEGLDLGLDELEGLNVNPNEDSNVPTGHLQITGVDAHCLPGPSWFSFLPIYQTTALVEGYVVVALTTTARAIDAPPW